MGLTPAENFLAAFATLKSQVGGKPQNVGWTTKESQRTALLAFFTYVEWRRLEVMLATSPTKAVARAPTSLKSSYRDYKHDWANAIEKAVNDLLEGDADFLLKVLGRSEAVSSDSENEEEHRPDFDPIRDDPAALIDDMVWLSEITADEDSELGDQQRKAIQAWDFFRETIGLDLDGVSHRWRRIEPIFMPSHIANAYGLSEPASLNHILDQAVHAYVFGVPAAALAMFRAITELVLTKHYKCDGVDLERIIVAAEARPQSAWMKRLRLQQKRRLANSVLHEYRQVEEKAVIEFLKVVKELIEKAPGI